LILAVALLMLPALGRAQVYVNQAALDQLAGVEAPAAAPPVVRPAPARRVVYRPHVKTIVKPAAPVQVASAAVVPKVVAPVKPAAPVAPAVVRPVYKGPVTLKFAPGSDALPPGAAAALAGVCGLTVPVTVDARAADDASDPSAALRLSLARALAVKAALTGCGVPGTRVLPRALGDVAGADENAVTVGALNK
jgi:hypothetical protein